MIDTMSSKMYSIKLIILANDLLEAFAVILFRNVSFVLSFTLYEVLAQLQYDHKKWTIFFSLLCSSISMWTNAILRLKLQIRVASFWHWIVTIDKSGRIHNIKWTHFLWNICPLSSSIFGIFFFHNKMQFWEGRNDW